MEKLIANGVIFLNGQNVIKNVEEACNIVSDLSNYLLVKVEVLAKAKLEKKEVATIVNVHVSNCILISYVSSAKGLYDFQNES